MPEIDYAQSSFPRGNNISRPDLIPNITNRGSRPFLLNSSRFSDECLYQHEFKGQFQGFIGRDGATEQVGERYVFKNPQTFVIKSRGESNENNIRNLTITFDDVADQYATRIIVDGVAFTNTATEFRIGGLPDMAEHTIQITDWNKPDYPVRITSIVPNDVDAIMDIRFGKPKSGVIRPAVNDLEPFGKFFSSWSTKNPLVYTNLPGRTLDATLHNMSADASYIPEVQFAFNFLTPQEYCKIIQILNTREFVVEYYDTELLMRVKRCMFLPSHEKERMLAVGREYKGMIKAHFKLVSKYGYDDYDDLVSRDG